MFPNRLETNAVGTDRDLIDLSELDIRSKGEGSIISDEACNEIFNLLDDFLIDNKNIMELIANKLCSRVTQNFQKEAGKLVGTKIAKENQQLITQLIELLANKDEQETGAQMIKTMTDLLAQHGMAGYKDGQFLDSIKDALAEINGKSDDTEFRGQPDIKHFDIGSKIDIEDWIGKYKDAMGDKKISIEKEVSQLKLLTNGADSTLVKGQLKVKDYGEKRTQGQLTQEWFDNLLEKMKTQFTNLNPWVGELSFQSLAPKVNEEVQDYYSRVYLEGRKLGKSDQDIANTFLRGLPFSYQVHILNQKPTTSPNT